MFHPWLQLKVDVEENTQRQRWWDITSSSFTRCTSSFLVLFFFFFSYSIISLLSLNKLSSWMTASWFSCLPIDLWPNHQQQEAKSLCYPWTKSLCYPETKSFIPHLPFPVFTNSLRFTASWLYLFFRFYWFIFTVKVCQSRMLTWLPFPFRVLSCSRCINKHMKLGYTHIEGKQGKCEETTSTQ